MKHFVLFLVAACMLMGCGHKAKHASLVDKPEAIVASTLEAAPAVAASAESVRLIGPDSDQDGAPDACDECPGTQTGVAVDSFGCPAAMLLELGLPYEPSDSAGGDCTAAIRRVGELLAVNPHSAVSVECHTDNAGDAEKNLFLSRRRARAIVETLASQGVDKSRISAEGYGQTRPVASNDSVEGRQTNRRISITVAGVYSMAGASLLTGPAVAVVERRPEATASVRGDGISADSQGEVGLVPLTSKPNLLTIPFQVYEASVADEFAQSLASLAMQLRRNPAARATIAGHTDNTGSAASNERLSRQRAESVRRFLVERYGVAPDQLLAQGMGMSQPIADNATPEGRKRNRRVTISIQDSASVVGAGYSPPRGPLATSL